MAETVLTTAVEFWNALCEMAPYLLFGFLVAGALSVLISPEAVERHLGGGGMWPVVKATIFGIPLPLCSCGVIPVAASLRRHGSSRAATTAFLLSTPQTGVDSILVTFSLLGSVFAVFRPLAALVTGVVGGWLVTLLGSDKENATEPAPRCDDPCCSDDDRHGRLNRAIRYGFVTLPQDIAKPLFIGLAVAGVIAALVPDDYFAGILGSGLLAMLVMMLIGLPVYVCATASVPVAAALIAKGVSPGAALVFLMTGPATNAAAVTTIWKVTGRRTAIIYLGTVALTALAAGTMLDYVFAIRSATAAPGMPWMLPGFVKTASAFVLLGVLGAAVVRPLFGRAPTALSEQSAGTAALVITGMTCNHCVLSVRRALLECAGVESAQVDLRTGRAIVRGTDIDVRALCSAVEQLGYAAVELAGPGLSPSAPNG